MRVYLKNINKKKINFIISFLFERIPKISFIKKLLLVLRFFYISLVVKCAHNNVEMLTIARSIFLIPSSIKGVVIEAGSYKGGSTAKLSLVANTVGRKLVVFDSFQGIPSNKEVQTHNRNKKIFFILPEGIYKGSLNEVKKNIERYGAPGICMYKKGLFEQTMPKFHKQAAAIFLDVDLASSTRTCLKYLYPLLQPGGILFSHDGYFVSTANVFKDKKFWKKEIGITPPFIRGIGKQKLLKLIKPFK